MSEAGYSREGRERYLRAGNRIEMLGKITYPISADEVVFFLALKHSEWVAAHSAHIGTKVAPSSADGVPGGRERARQSRVPTGPRYPREAGATRQSPPGCLWSGAPREAFPQSLLAPLHFRLRATPTSTPPSPYLTEKSDSARARNWPCWGPEG